MRRLYILLLIASVVVAAVLVAVFHREREPGYGGKRLSEWVDRIGTSRASGFMIYRRGRQHYVMCPSEVLGPIRLTGTNAIPYLLDWIRYEPPAWKTRSIASLNKIFGLKLIDYKAQRAEGAMGALCILGEKAEDAIQRLTVLTNDSKATNTAMRAGLALNVVREVLEKRMEVIGRY